MLPTPARVRTPRPIDLAAPRPLFTAALNAYRSGALTGTRWYRLLASREYYRQRRRSHPALQFHGLSTRGLPAWTNQIKPLAPAEQDSFDAADYRLASFCRCFDVAGESPLCLAAGRCLRLNTLPLARKPYHLLRAHYTRPLYSPLAHKMLRYSRMQPMALRHRQRGLYLPLRPRPRTKHRLSTGTMHYLAARRAAAAQCARRGYQRIRPGIWHDQVCDVIYIQTDIIATTPYIGRVVA